MTKIGILTFFSSINFGAFLQAFSLQEFLRDRYGKNVSVQVINYTSQKSYEFYKDFNELKKDKFFGCWKCLNLTPDGIITDDISCISKYITELSLDIILVGSDELWKTDGMRGFPNAYWCNYDVGKSRRIAYAVSGRNDYQIMDPQAIQYIKEALNRFDYLGVRDGITKKEITGLGEYNVYLNCDPSILYREKLRFNSEEKEKLRKKWKKDYARALVVLMVSDYALAKHLYRMLSNENVVYDVFEEGEQTDRNVYVISPFEWSELISVADCVITSLFHGTVFSMIHDTPFVSIEFSKNGRGKVENILMEHGLEDNLVRASEYSDSMKAIGMEAYTRCRKQILNKHIESNEEMLIKEENKSSSFIAFMDKLLKE